MVSAATTLTSHFVQPMVAEHGSNRPSRPLKDSKTSQVWPTDPEAQKNLVLGSINPFKLSWSADKRHAAVERIITRLLPVFNDRKTKDAFSAAVRCVEENIELTVIDAHRVNTEIGVAAQHFLFHLKQLGVLAGFIQKNKNLLPGHTKFWLKDLLCNFIKESRVCLPGLIKKFECDFSIFLLKVFPPSFENLVLEKKREVIESVVREYLQVKEGAVNVHQYVAFINALKKDYHFLKNTDYDEYENNFHVRDSDLSQIKKKISDLSGRYSICKLLAQDLLDELRNDCRDSCSDLTKPSNWLSLNEHVNLLKSRFTADLDIYDLVEFDEYLSPVRVQTEPSKALISRFSIASCPDFDERVAAVPWIEGNSGCKFFISGLFKSPLWLGKTDYGKDLLMSKVRFSNFPDHFVQEVVLDVDCAKKESWFLLFSLFHADNSDINDFLGFVRGTDIPENHWLLSFLVCENSPKAVALLAGLKAVNCALRSGDLSASEQFLFLKKLIDAECSDVSQFPWAYLVDFCREFSDFLPSHPSFFLDSVRKYTSPWIYACSKPEGFLMVKAMLESRQNDASRQELLEVAFPVASLNPDWLGRCFFPDFAQFLPSDVPTRIRFIRFIRYMVAQGLALNVCWTRSYRAHCQLLNVFLIHQDYVGAIHFLRSVDRLDHRFLFEHSAAEKLHSTLLQQLAWLGQVEAIVHALQMGANVVGKRANMLSTPLALAIAQGHPQAVRVLLERGALIEQQKFKQFADFTSWVQRTAVEEVWEVYEAFLQQQHIEERNRVQDLPTVLAQNDDDALLDFLIAQGRLNQPIPNERGDLFLHRVARLGNVQLLNRAVEFGARVDQRRDRKFDLGSLPIHQALRAGQMECVKRLLELGSPYKGFFIRGMSPIMYGRFNGFQGVEDQQRVLDAIRILFVDYERRKKLFLIESEA